MRRSGRATSCSAISPRRRRTRSGSATSPTSGPGRASATSPSSFDCHSRALVGWQLTTHLRTELVLEMANGLRQPSAGLIAHSDRGSQYTSLAYTDRLDELGLAPSVGSRGDAYDNALAVAWVATFKSELVDGRRFSSFEHAEHEVLHWIGFYNEERLHEELGDLPPAEYEELNIRRDNSSILSAR